MHFCTLQGGFNEWMEHDLLISAFNIYYWCCNFVLLVDVGLRRDRSLLLKLMSRTSYKWYVYLLTISSYVLRWYSCSVIYIWMLECLSYHLALLYGDSYLFMLNIWVTYYAICFPQLFHLTVYTKWFIFIEFFSHSN